MHIEDPFYKKRFSLISEEEQKKEGTLPADSANPADFEEQILSKFKEEGALKLEQDLLNFKEKRALASSVLHVPRNEYVPGLDYPIERPISRWSEVINEKSIEHLDLDETEIENLYTKIENIYKEKISDPRKDLQFNLILKKIKNSNNKLDISFGNRGTNQLEELITFVSESISDKELYIISRLYEADISFDFGSSWDEIDLKKIINIPFFEKALSIIENEKNYKDSYSLLLSLIHI